MNKEDLLQLKMGEEEPQVFTRWIDPTIEQLQQENKQLKSILTELEEWLEMMEEKETIGTYSMVQDKIQELKEKYK